MTTHSRCVGLFVFHILCLVSPDCLHTCQYGFSTREAWWPSGRCPNACTQVLLHTGLSAFILVFLQTVLCSFSLSSNSNLVKFFLLPCPLLFLKHLSDFLLLIRLKWKLSIAWPMPASPIDLNCVLHSALQPLAVYLLHFLPLTALEQNCFKPRNRALKLKPQAVSPVALDEKRWVKGLLTQVFKKKFFFKKDVIY